MFISRDPIGLMGGSNVFQYAPSPVHWIDPFGLSGTGSYSTWQIHSPGYNDVVQKGLHFYAPGNIELSVRPNHLGGITFTNAIPNEKGSPKVIKAIAEAKVHYCKDERFRKDILNKAREGVSSVLAHKNDTNDVSLKNLANGRSRELLEIQRSVQRYENQLITCRNKK